MSGEGSTDGAPHGSTRPCLNCGEDVHKDVGRNEAHFKVEFNAAMDACAVHGIACSARCLAKWAEEVERAG